MNTWRVLLSLFAVLITGADTLVAAGSADATADPVTLVTTVWGGDQKLHALEGAAAVYMEQFPNVNVEFLVVPAGEYNERVIALAESDNPPDIISTNNALVLELNERFADLTQVMKTQGYLDPKDGLYEGWLHMLAADGYYNDGDRLFQAPLSSGTTVLAYNKRMFDEAALSYPTPAWTWEGEFLESARALSDLSKTKWGVSGIDGDFVYPAVVAAYGGKLFDLETAEFLGDTAESKEALQFMQDLIYRDKVSPNIYDEQMLGYTGVDMFKNNNTAMYFLNTFEIPELYDFDDAWDIQRLPEGEAGTWAPIYGTRVAVLEDSEHFSDAWNFIHVLNSREGQLSFITHLGYADPPLQSVANKEEFRAGTVSGPPSNWIRQDSLTRAVITDALLPQASQVYSELENQLWNLWRNEINAESAMDTASAIIKPLLQEGY